LECHPREVLLTFRPAIPVIAILLLAGCAALSLPDQKTAADMAGGPIPAGKARIIVLAGTWYSGGGAFTYPNSFDVAIDGVGVGNVGPDEAMAVDVLPGRHVVTRNFPIFRNVPSIAVAADLGSVAAGQRVFVAVDRVEGGAEEPSINGDFAGPLDPHLAPGEYFHIRNDPKILQRRTFVNPDPQAVARLNER
jgi:hypothetical protein